MSEIPERKVLKSILSKLKTKTISSGNGFKESIVNNRKLFDTAFHRAMEVKKEHKGEIIAVGLFDVVNGLRDSFYEIISDALRYADDLILYIESLENYSVELDTTLTTIFEKAKQIAEEQQKQQEELIKKKPSDSYIK